MTTLNTTSSAFKSFQQKCTSMSKRTADARTRLAKATEAEAQALADLLEVTRSINQRTAS